MGLTLTTNPVTGTSQTFAGHSPVEFVFKREDIAITTVTSGTGGAKINHSGDLTSILSIGDTVYFYSEGTGYTYDFSAQIIEIAAGEVTVNKDFIVTGTAGYMNYLANYFVELQCVHPTLPLANLLPFSLEADGDAAGNIIIDVSVVNDLNEHRGDIVQGFLSDSVREFEVKYRQVYDGSSESFTLVDNKLVILLKCVDTPEDEVVLNSFELPKLFLGYDAGLVISNLADPVSSTIQLIYDELDINNNIISSGDLGTIGSDVNGFLLWKWAKDITINANTKFVEFAFDVDITTQFLTGDFATPDFETLS